VSRVILAVECLNNSCTTLTSSPLPLSNVENVWRLFRSRSSRHTYATLLKGNGEDVKVVQELMRHANISVTLNIYAQAITQTKRDAQSRVVSLLLDKNEEKPSTEAYRTLTDVQNSGGDLQVVDKVGVPDGI
jgi:Phage integrase family